MSRRIFGFAFSASMLPSGTVSMTKTDLTVDEVRAELSSYELCLNPSHKATIDAARTRFGLQIAIPEKPANITLAAGDSVIVMQVIGLPRLTDRREYSPEEIASASFTFVEIRLNK